MSSRFFERAMLRRAERRAMTEKRDAASRQLASNPMKYAAASAIKERYTGSRYTETQEPDNDDVQAKWRLSQDQKTFIRVDGPISRAWKRQTELDESILKKEMEKDTPQYQTPLEALQSVYLYLTEVRADLRVPGKAAQMGFLAGLNVAST